MTCCFFIFHSENLEKGDIMKLSIGLVVCCLVFAFTQVLQAQVEQPKRVELDISDDDNVYTVVNAEEFGLIAFRDLKKKDLRKKTAAWEFLMFDTLLTKQWVKNYEFESDLIFTGYDYDDNRLFLLFKTGDIVATDLRIVELDLYSGDTLQHRFKQITPITPTHFEVIGDNAILAGQLNFRAAAIHYDLTTKKTKVFPWLYGDKTELMDLSIDEENNLINILVTERLPDKRTTLALKIYNEKGKMLSNLVLKPERNYSLLDGAVTKLDDGKVFIVGTYARKKSRYSRGIFIAETLLDGSSTMRHYNYGELDNFFSYMKERRESRVKDRIQRRISKGKVLKFNYRLLVHDIIERNGQYIMIAEAYYPKYNNNTHHYAYGSMWHNPYYGPNRMNNMNFAGYRYTHAVVLGFNKMGALQWDHCFEINDITTFNLERFVNLSFKNEQLVLMYMQDNVIRSKIVKDSQVVEGKNFHDIRTQYENDEIKSTRSEVSSIHNWYKEYFYAYGTQKIKNSATTEAKLNREVFYINKVTYNQAL